MTTATRALALSVLASGILWTAAGSAQNVDPATGGLQCSVDGDSVTLGWAVAGEDPTLISGGLLSRDGTVIARIPAGTVSYRDGSVPPGRHMYLLTLANSAGLTITMECEVFVGEDTTGIRCDVNGRIVTVTWTVSEGLLAFGFLVSRDGEIVAALGPDARSCSDEAPPGKHTYLVSTNNRLGGPNDPALGAPDYLVGECEVLVEGVAPGIRCGVSDGAVSIAWEPLDLTLPILRIDVRRDGRTVAHLPPSATGYEDAAPPGAHMYSVHAMLLVDPAAGDPNAAGDAVDEIVGICQVIVEGEPGLPGPQDLSCAVAESFPVQVQLRWTNPVRYDSIVVTRDNLQVARLEGSATRFGELDPGPGRHLYGVQGMSENRWSPSATCVVETSGPAAGDRLFMEPHPASAAGDPNIDPAGNVGTPATDAVTVLLTSGREVQAWSFGITSDPTVLAVAEATTAGTDAGALNDGQGPTFLVINVLEAGVTMAAIVDEENPAAVLPPGAGYSLLRVRYVPGPDAARGRPYVVDFSSALGVPPVETIIVAGGFEVYPATSPGIVSFVARRFLRGDGNNDGQVNITDAVHLLDWLFLGGAEPACLEATDTNGSLNLNIADAVYILQALFIGGQAPPAPFPECGSAPVALGCDESACD